MKKLLFVLLAGMLIPDAVEEMMIRAGKHQKAMMKAQQNYLQRK